MYCWHYLELVLLILLLSVISTVGLLYAAVGTGTGGDLLDDLRGGALPHVDVLPEEEVPHLAPRPQDLVPPDEEKVPEFARVTPQIAPDGPRPLFDFQPTTLGEIVDQEVAEEVGVSVFRQLQQVSQVELKMTGKLEQQLQ